MVRAQNPHSVASAFRAADPRILRRRSLWLLPLVIPGLYAAATLPAQAAPAVASVAAPATQSVSSVGSVRASVTRSSFHATTAAQIEAKNAAAAAAAAQATASSAPAVQDAPAPSAHLGAIVAYAERFVGTPYVYGGSTPSGFDCSGFTMYVYARFGISLPHSSAAQGQMGTRVSLADARPGDLVIVDGGSHVGIYTGGGNFIDSPMPGRSISVRPIYTSDYYIVRIR